MIADRYRLEERLGRGGMGEVWRAHDQRLQRTVAMKLIAPQFADDPEFLVRFLREAQSIARINHPNVVAVLDYGEADEKPFIVMEYVPGEPLTTITGQPVDPDRVVAIMVQAASAAGAAHAQGIVHRDIKPGNILVTEEGNAKLVDFGIAAAQWSDRLTATGATIGSPHYISPEQVSGERATPPSDVYSLGVVLYELLTGTRPFEGEVMTAVAMAHIQQEPEPPSARVKGLDPSFDAVVLKCLAKKPEQRFEDGNALAQALQSRDQATAVMGAGAAGGTMVMGTEEAAAGPPPPPELPEEKESWVKPALMGLLIGLVLLAGLVALLAALRDEPGTGTNGGNPQNQGGGGGQQQTEEAPPPDETEEEPAPPPDEPPADTESPTEEPTTESPTENPTDVPTDELPTEDGGENGDGGNGGGG
jgi:serine/threonine-protein kinase